MQFDDRLTTVLDQPASTRRDKAVRWRQLVDLVARSGAGDGGPVLDRAIERIAADAKFVDQPLRAAAARSISALPLRIELLEIFAGDVLAVSAPILAAAMLENEQWARLAAVADEETRRFIETLHPEAVGAAAVVEASPEAQPPGQREEPAPEAPGHSRSLADVVAAIERRRRRRDALRSRWSGARDSSLALFRWECGPSGDIQWVDGAPRGALIGRSIAAARQASGDGPANDIARAFAMRSPFRDGAFVIGGDSSVAGEWKMSGVPAFEPADGRFAGYRGLAQRDERAASAEDSAIPDPASLRELVHEIKTPLNAIMGFAEIIDGEYLGPADRPYRERAAHIVGQSRLLLGAIDDLDFAAKVLASARDDEDVRTDLRQVLADLLPELRASARERGADVELPRGSTAIEAAIPEELAERVIRRMLAAVIEHARRGEILRLSVDRSGERCRVGISRPVALEGVDKDRSFDLEPAAEGDGASNFSLRLARGLARVAGLSLVAGERDFALLFRSA